MHIDIASLDAVLFSFYWLDIQDVKKYLAQKEASNAVFSEDVNIEPLLNLQYAYNPNPARAAFFSVANGATIMFPNLQDGWITLFNNITNGLNAKACNIKIIDYNKIVDPGAYLWYVENSHRRIVYTLKEDRWVFWQEGCPQSFENTAYYSARQKKDRLNKNILLEYCENLGILKNGAITFNLNNAFSYELFWTGKFANSKGTGAASFTRK